MIYTVENDFLTVSVNSFGAELWSLKSKESQREYVWQGKPEIWSGRAPILFPIVGQLQGGNYKYGGRKYELPKHGFARKSEFILSVQEKNSLTMTLSFNDSTLKSFPFKFRLSVKHTLIDERLEVEHRVENLDDKIIYFSIGAHPGFNCELGSYLEFELYENADSLKIDNEAMLTDRRDKILEDSKILVLQEDTFKEDALIFEKLNSSRLTLKDKNGKSILKFDFGKPSYLGLWAKPAAPYVCIEPWYGINDSRKKDSDFTKKQAIQSLNPGEDFFFSWNAEIIL
ncbi:MAG TPA: aldose 1-epimerase family protein [Clostridiales bacterium]|nr:aldose 1-epimerase family protein [Clostridiales bacterium]HRT82385.1 aldose 1-epimerase family protein [Oscillospiraceae bacterium]